LSPEFNLLLIKEFQRLKDEETRRLNSEWDYSRFLSKVNYVVHTDAILKYVVPKITEEDRKKWIYAEEADLLNIALFGFTAKQWRDANPQLVIQGHNVRDIADIHQLLVLANLEGYNAILNQQGIDKRKKLPLLTKAAEQQLISLRNSKYTEEQIRSPFVLAKKKIDASEISE
ncbi:MAG TPA: KilA-N domain-containing protein, partial [Mucilaginibacter sp.]